MRRAFDRADDPSHVRTWSADTFRLDLWDTGRSDSHGKSILRYRLEDTAPIDGDENAEPWGEIFDGDDFACSPLHAIDSDECVAAVLCFLSLQQGDTDREYFDGYTPHQLAWRDMRAKQLSFFVFELEEGEQ